MLSLGYGLEGFKGVFQGNAVLEPNARCDLERVHGLQAKEQLEASQEKEGEARYPGNSKERVRVKGREPEPEQ